MRTSRDAPEIAAVIPSGEDEPGPPDDQALSRALYDDMYRERAMTERRIDRRKSFPESLPAMRSCPPATGR